MQLRIEACVVPMQTSRYETADGAWAKHNFCNMSSFKAFFFLHIFIGFTQLSKGHKDALLVIDVQNCFLSGGSLPVEKGEEVIPVINSLRREFDVVAFTRDWHCKEHISFVSQHSGLKPFDQITLKYDSKGKLCELPSSNLSQRNCNEDDVKYTVDQQVFVDHCIMDTSDAALNSGLQILPEKDIFVNKGYNCEVDSYSAFFNNGGFEKTELESKFKELAVSRVYVVGIALDYCVFYSAMDAQKLGFETFVVLDAARGISKQGVDKAMQQMKANNIQFVLSKDILGKEEL